MRSNVRKLSFLSLFTALSTVLVLLSSIVPAGRLSLLAAAGIPAAMAVLFYGTGEGFLVYLAAGILSALIVPLRSALILFFVFLGYYPVVKSLIERMGKLFPEWALKLLLFNGVLTLLSLVFSAVLTEMISDSAALPLLYAAGNAAFIAYDIGLTGLLYMLRKRLSGLMRE